MFRVLMKCRHSLLLTLALNLGGCTDSTEPALSERALDTPQSITSPVAVDLDHLERNVADLLTEVFGRAVALPNDGTRRGELAMAYEVNGFTEAAMASYVQAEHLSSDDPRWAYFQAREFGRRGDLYAALDALSRVLVLEPNHLPSLMWQGTWSLAVGDTDAAERSFLRAKSLGQGWAADASLGKLLLQQRRAADAVALLEPLSRTAPFPSVFHLLGSAYRQVGKEAPSRIALARGRDRQPVGWLDSWDDLKKPYRQSFEDRLRGAQVQIRLHNLREAVSLLQQLLTEQPENPVVLTTLSNTYVLTGEGQRGFWLLRRAIEKSPVHHSILVNIAAFYAARGDAVTALEHLDSAIAVHPTGAQAYLRKARLLVAKGEWKPALAAFDSALVHDASDARPHVEAGDILLRLGRRESAMLRYRNAITVDAAYLPAYLKYAEQLVKAGDRETARTVLETALLIDASSPRLLAALSGLDSDG